jgi:hypothetical protein
MGCAQAQIGACGFTELNAGNALLQSTALLLVAAASFTGSPNYTTIVIGVPLPTDMPWP